MCSDLSNHVFDYGQKALAHHIRTTRQKLLYHIGTIHGHNISNKLQNYRTVIIPKPNHTQDVLDEQYFDTKRIDQSYQRIVEAHKFQNRVLEDQIIDRTYHICQRQNDSSCLR